MAFSFPQKILFRHCDPAGIVFYPRFFEMMNDCVEAFFERELAFPFSEIHLDGAVPTAEISTTFLAPCRLGEELTIELQVTNLGRTSMGLTLRAECDGETRFETRSTLVFVNEQGRPQPWPEQVRHKVDRFLNR